jgi:hypothetical protein
VSGLEAERAKKLAFNESVADRGIALRSVGGFLKEPSPPTLHRMQFHLKLLDTVFLFC